MNPGSISAAPAILAAAGGAIVAGSHGSSGSPGAVVAGAGLLCGAALLQAYLILRSQAATRALVGWCDEAAAVSQPPEVPRPFLELADHFHARLRHAEARATGQSSDVRRARVEARSLQKQHHALTALIESLADGVVLIDGEGTPRIVNRAARQLLELPDDPEAAEFPAGIRNPALKAAVADAVKGGPEARLARDLDCSDATRRLVLRIMFQSVRNADDPADEASLAIVLRDVTRERELNRMKSDFASSVSHELKTPLSSMRAFLEMLIDGDIEGEDERREHLQMVLDESERLTRLIQNLLNLSRLESGVTRMDRDPVPMSELIEHLRQLAAPLAKARAQDISFDVSDFLPSVTGDRNLLEQAIMNLVSNAIKYTPEGGAVHVAAGLSGAEVEVVVTDTGVGIPEKALGLIFEKFTRVENSAGLKATGTGLGLPLARFVAEAHGGRITVTSEVGKGSAFRLRLPARRGVESGESRLVGLEDMAG